ncbi:MAG TPA: PRTRC system protein F, partial [Telluria sp.]
RAGFGQTVLALLMDATRYLPESLTPWAAGWMAEVYYWDGTSTDEELIEYRMQEYGYATREDLIEDTGGLMTRESFYKNIPRWATLPQRVLSREEIGRAARAGWAREVAEACDAIAAAVHMPEFRFLRRDEVGSNRAGDCVDGCMVLLWHGPGDEIGNVIDYVLNEQWQSGEAHELIDAQPVPLTKRGIRRYQRRTEQVLKLAELTERLVLLIGERCE